MLSGHRQGHAGHIPKTCGSTSYCVKDQNWTVANTGVESDTGNEHVNPRVPRKALALALTGENVIFVK